MLNLQLLALHVLQGTAAEVALGLHLLAGGLIWLAPSTAKSGLRAGLMRRLAALPGAHLPDGHSTAAASQPAPPTGEVGGMQWL